MTMKSLKFVVHCKSIYPFYEVVAAFDSESVAHCYAESCAKTNPNFTYRVTTRRGTVINTYGAEG